VYYSASLQKQRIQDAMTQGLYEKTRDSQEVRLQPGYLLQGLILTLKTSLNPALTPTL